MLAKLQFRQKGSNLVTDGQGKTMIRPHYDRYEVEEIEENE